MASKCHRTNINNNIASIILNNHHHQQHHRPLHSFRRKLLHLIACGSASHHHQNSLNSPETEPEPEPEQSQSQSDSVSNSNPPGSGKLSDLLLTVSSSSSSSASSTSSLSFECSEAAKRRKVDALEEMKGVVRKLADGKELEDVLEAASDVRRLAKDDPFARETLAMLGVIPPLIELLDRVDQSLPQHAAAPLYALLNLAIRNDLNKAAIVKAGAVHKMLRIIEKANGSPSALVSEAIVANFLGLSALDSNKVLIGSSGAIPFLVKIVTNVGIRSGSQIRQDALRALYNLSIEHVNVGIILETELVLHIVNALGDMDVSERILSILSNVVSTAEGRKAISFVSDAFPILVDVLNWNDSPGCQEKALYVLMAIAHKMSRVRQSMVDAGVKSALLELTLVGSTLVQKRASRILDFLNMEKGKGPSDRYNGSLTTTLSAPICGSSSNVSSWDHKESSENEHDMMSEEKKAVNKLVQQSLQKNMNRIAQRANLPQDFVPSESFKTLTLSSTSKSLPF